MNERRRAHVDFYLQRPEYWHAHKPSQSTARLLAARDADAACPLRTEEEAMAVVEHIRRLELSAGPRYPLAIQADDDADLT
jgi:hypothetical protein